jgi:hypothetical protein
MLTLEAWGKMWGSEEPVPWSPAAPLKLQLSSTLLHSHLQLLQLPRPEKSRTSSIMARRSARVASLETSPDYTEPNESGRPSKRKSSTTQSSPNAKRVNKSRSKENLKQQKTLDDAMDM